MTSAIEKTSEKLISEVYNAQLKYQWRQRLTSATQRIDKLKKLRNAISSHSEELKRALYKDLRKSPSAVEEGDIASTFHTIDNTIIKLESWMAPVEVEISPGSAAENRARIIYEPRGIVLLFGPWNFPFNLVFEPLAQIISAGNCAIVKPNEMAPNVSRVTANIIREVFQPEEVAVFEGGVSLANQLLELPVDHIFFTGSPAVGKIVMAAAAKHLASVTLELGGKNPVIIGPDADITDAAGNIAFMRTINSGQLCLCPENVYLHEDQLGEFLAVAAGTFQAVFYSEGKLDQNILGKVIDSRNFQRIKSYLDDAKEKGATIACGGETEEDTLLVHPTILTNVPEGAKILEEEVFAPILSVFTYKDIEEVYQTLQKQPKPLALYVFSNTDEFVQGILANTTSGGVTVNSCIMHYAEHNLPFGGVNNSGIGRYHGIHGFKELSHERAVLYTS